MANAPDDEDEARGSARSWRSMPSYHSLVPSQTRTGHVMWQPPVGDTPDRTDETERWSHCGGSEAQVAFEGLGLAPNLPGIWRFEYWGYPVCGASAAASGTSLVRMAWSAPFLVQAPLVRLMAIATVGSRASSSQMAEGATEAGQGAAASEETATSPAHRCIKVEVHSGSGRGFTGGHAGPSAAPGGGSEDFLAVAHRLDGGAWKVDLTDPEFSHCEATVDGRNGDYEFSVVDKSEARQGVPRVPRRTGDYAIVYCKGGHGLRTD